MWAMSSTLSSQSGSDDFPKPGCDGAIMRRSRAMRSMKGMSGAMPAPPCRERMGAPGARSGRARTSRARPPRSRSCLSVLLFRQAWREPSRRLPLIGAELGAGLLRKRHVDHVARLDLAGDPALLEEEVEILLHAGGIHRAGDVYGLRIYLAHEGGIHVEAFRHGRNDLVGAGAGDLSLLDRIVVAAHAAQPGAHEFLGHVFALARELVAEEDHGDLLVRIELVGVHEAHAISGVDGDRCLRLAPPPARE